MFACLEFYNVVLFWSVCIFCGETIRNRPVFMSLCNMGFEPLKSCCGVQILISACTHHQLFFWGPSFCKGCNSGATNRPAKDWSSWVIVAGLGPPHHAHFKTARSNCLCLLLDFTTLTWNIWHDFPVNCDRESSLGIVCVRCTTRSWCVIDSLCLLSSHISSFIDDDWPGYYIPEGEVFTQRAARWSRCWRSIFHFYRKWIWHRTGFEIRNWNAFHALPEAASSSESLTGPTNFHGCPHGLAMASSYEELLTKSCTVKFGFPHLWMVFPRRCNLPRWTRTSSSAERFPMPPSTHVIWRNSVRYSSTHCLLMSIRPFLSVSSTHSKL